MRVPRSTYRLQFNPDFTFSDAEEIVPYLHDLGVDTLYASPLTKASSGSTHGYDVVDPNALNPELGSREEFDRLARALRDRGMGLLLDIVPNHMGVGSENAWWMHMLENGPASPYASFFDVDWDRGNGKILLPVLGDHYRAVLEGGELELTFDEGSFSVNYYEHRFPLDPKTYPMVLEGVSGDDVAGSPGLARVVEENVRRLNGDYEALHRVLEAQAYRLAYWRVGGDRINYRRFFAVNDLAGVRVEDEQVFDATHHLILSLLTNGSVDGLRVDHPDGLYDPAGYLRRLQDASPGPVYVLVEKILAHNERLPLDWPVSGTTGYEFTNLATGLFVDPAGEKDLDAAYHGFVGIEVDYEEIVHDRKKLVMRTDLAGELDALSGLLLRISDEGRRRDFTTNQLRDALSEVVAHFPVYRTYVTAGSVSEDDRRHVEEAVGRAREESAAADTTVYDFIRDALVLDLDGPAEYREMVVHFAMKFQQYTGPVMAKGVEDAALYVYDRLASLNEVGGEPDRFGASVSEFHRENAVRARDWPHAMLSSTTHDTKRGEDVRARVSVLSELPDEWRARISAWSNLNASHHRGEMNSPSPNDEYLLYQTLLGAWPLGEIDETGLEDFRGRILAYMEKAIREAQANTSWTDPDEEYETGVAHFIDALLSPDSPFLPEFLPFQHRIARLGAMNSLSQTLLKLTAPGVPDVYQGNELWDFSLVDPDNRRPVDYELHRKLLENLENLDPSSLLGEGAWQDGRPKLYLTRKALGLRRESPALFESGEYIPLKTAGESANHIVAFARRRGRSVAISAAPRLCANLLDNDGPLLPDPERWADTAVRLPEVLAGATYLDVLTDKKVEIGEHDGEATLSVGALLRGFPVALLTAGG